MTWRWAIASLTTVTALCASAALAAPETAAPAAPPKPQGVEARLRIGDRPLQKVVLVGRKDGKVVYHFAESAQVVSAVTPGDITSIRLGLAIDKAAIAKARRAGDFATAAGLLGGAVAPALPFLDIKDNNALPYVLRAGVYFLVAAEQKVGCHFEPQERAIAEKEYLYAYALVKAAMVAEWSEHADEARMLAVVSLVGLRRTPEAAELLGSLSEPDDGDNLCGLYSLARAEVLNAQDRLEEALEAAIRGLTFEDKDLGTFPTSLLLAAHCYARRDDWYRARDVYYEVAQLFPGTHWEAAARRALTALMEAGRTKAPETAAAQTVFFGLDEDVNAKVLALLNPAPAERPANSPPGGAPPAAGVKPMDPPGTAPAAADQKRPNQETPKP